jgi:hypothetical protein
MGIAANSALTKIREGPQKTFINMTIAIVMVVTIEEVFLVRAVTYCFAPQCGQAMALFKVNDFLNVCFQLQVDLQF